MDAVTATPALPPFSPTPPSGLAADGGWADLVGKTVAMFAASAPLSAGDAAQVGQQVAAIRGTMAAALTAAQAVRGSVPAPAKAATPKQAADQALQWVQAYVATYDAWLAVLMRHHTPAPSAAAMPRGAKAVPPAAGPGPAPQPDGAAHAKQQTRPTEAKCGPKEPSAQASLLAHALTLWTQNVTAAFSALPAHVPPQQAHEDPDTPRRRLELARRNAHREPRPLRVARHGPA